MPLALIIVALQVIAVVHLFRPGRDMRWLFLIILLPAIGCLAYFVVEVLPSLQQNRAARDVLRRARNAVDPHRGVREGSLDYERSQNIETASRLAGELTKAGRHEEAIRVCTEARTGLFEDDPKILPERSKKRVFLRVWGWFRFSYDGKTAGKRRSSEHGLERPFELVPHDRLDEDGSRILLVDAVERFRLARAGDEDDRRPELLAHLMCRTNAIALTVQANVHQNQLRLVPLGHLDRLLRA
jgi:hypothetical protein